MTVKKSGIEATQEPVKIVFWDWKGGASGRFYEEEAERFHEKFPWITVEISHFPDQQAYREILARAFETGNAPDIFVRRHFFRQLIDNKWIQPLDPWVTPEWLAKFPKGSFVEGKNMWQGKIYSYTNYAPTFDRVFYINEDLFRKAGLVDETGDVKTPRVWSDLRSMAKQITEMGKGTYYGIGIGIKDARQMAYWFDLTCLAGAHGPVDFDYRSGRYAFGTNPAYVEIVKLLLGMKEDGSVYPYESLIDDSNQYIFFAQGKFAIFLSGSWPVGNLKQDFPDFQNYRVIPIPEPDGGRKGGTIITPAHCSFLMSSQTKHPHEVWLWLDWCSSREFHERMMKKGINLSVYTDLLTPAHITDRHRWQAYEATNKYSVVGPYPPVRNPETAVVFPRPVAPDAGDVLIGIYTGQITDWQKALKDLEIRKQTAFEEAIREARNAGANVSIDDFIFSDWDPMRNYVTRPNR